jgi:hypothetical protein
MQKESFSGSYSENYAYNFIVVQITEYHKSDTQYIAPFS